MSLLRPDADEVGAEPGVALAARLGLIVHGWAAARDTAAMLGQVVASALEVVEGAEQGSLTVVLGREAVAPQQASGDLAAGVDALQTSLGEGPCVEAALLGRVVESPDLGLETRWGRFPSLARESGAASLLSCPLRLGDDRLGALNLVSSRPYAFGEGVGSVASVLAAHAAVAFAGARQRDHLVRAVQSRDLIGQAKGLLMQRYLIDGDRAFRVLVRASQSSHRKLADVAEEVVRTRGLEVVEGAGPTAD